MSEEICKVYQSNAAKRIRELRDKKGLSQATLGEQINRSSAFISQLECDKTSPMLVDYCKLAEILELHPLELLTGMPRSVIDLAQQLTNLEPSERERMLKLFRLVTEMIELF